MKAILKYAALAATLTASALLLSLGATAQEIKAEKYLVTTGILIQTNQYRASLGSGPLVRNALLASAAQQYANHLARNNATGHTADGRAVNQRIASSGYQACFYAENVYEYWSQPNVPTAKVVVGKAMDFWKHSAGHEANLRDGRAKHVGVGVAAWQHSGRNYYKVVQVFGDDCGGASGKPLAVPSPASDVLNLGLGSRAADVIRANVNYTCRPGFVWRVARSTDLVCVTPESRARIAEENRNPMANKRERGGGTQCTPGFVWREAFDGDGICVTPQIRAFVAEENRLAPTRPQR